MKILHSLALSSASLLLLASVAHAGTVIIDGKVSPGEYTHATVTNTPYAPGADTSLQTFGNGNENVAETVYYQADPNGKGLDVAIQTDPAGVGKDNADASVGLQFTNLYFADPTNGKYLGFELGNNDAFDVYTGQKVTYDPAALGIEYVDVAGTTYANGGKGSTSEAYIPYSAYNTLEAELGLATDTKGEAIQLRDIQAFSYAGNNAGGARFGEVSFGASGVPEPGTWAMMLLGAGMMGVGLRMRRKTAAPATVAVAAA